MSANIEKKSLLHILATGACGAIILLAALTAAATAENIPIIFGPGTGSEPSGSGDTSGICLFSTQLAGDPALRAAFIAGINTFSTNKEITPVVDTDELYITNIDAGTPVSGPSSGLDKLSNDCLSCHDGISAPNFHVRIKNNPAGRVMSLEDIIGGHPVGMEYDKYVTVNSKEFRGEAGFSREMIFAEGKIGCLTCHNPLNSAKGHLVMKNERSELCFSCHNK